MSPPEVRPVDDLTPPEVLRALDAVLEVCRPELVGRYAYLEPMEERLVQADAQRILLCAWIDAHPVAVLDAQLHHPALDDLTVSQLAVARGARRRGLGRALVCEALRQATRTGEAPRAIFAAVRPNAFAAERFWAGLGLLPSRDHPGLLWAPAEALS